MKYKTSKSLLCALFMGAGMPAAALDLNDMLPPVRGGDLKVETEVKVNDSYVEAQNMSDGMASAYLRAIEGASEGVELIKVGSGIGILSVSSESYITYDNRNATLLSKRAAYAKAFMIAKKQLVEHMKGLANSCESAASDSLSMIDSGSDSVTNIYSSFEESCKESVQGALAGYVTYSVEDRLKDKEVYVAIASTEKTRTEMKVGAGAVLNTSNPNSAFKAVVADLKAGALPPIGAKILKDPSNGKTIIVAYGSSIVRTNRNKNISKKLKKVAKKQATMRARNALVGVMQGEKVYWEGGFDETQIQSTGQFEFAPKDETATEDEIKVLEEERTQFINTMSDTNHYKTFAAGHVPAGVQTKSFVGSQGNWAYSLAVYSPSVSLHAKKAANQIKRRGKNESHKESENSRKFNEYNGENDKVASPRGPSGQVANASNI
jgi:hypothetical protein